MAKITTNYSTTSNSDLTSVSTGLLLGTIGLAAAALAFPVLIGLGVTFFGLGAIAEVTVCVVAAIIELGIVGLFATAAAATTAAFAFKDIDEDTTNWAKNHDDDPTWTKIGHNSYYKDTTPYKNPTPEGKKAYWEQRKLDLQKNNTSSHQDEMREYIETLGNTQDASDI